jgi:hypothetical protein
MELFLVPYDPLQTVLVSPEGVAHYSVQTDKVRDIGYQSRRITTVQRPAESQKDSVVAEIAWKTWGTSTTIYGDLQDGMQSGLIVKEFLYKQGQFSQ